MEEADALGDYIIVMALGKAVCSGTTAFLKKACGVGYKISLVKAPTGFNLQGVLADIRKTAPNAEVEDEKQSQVIIALRTLNNTGFPAMFKTLEASKETLGFESMGVTVASMKDVYLKINMDWAPGGKEREEAVDAKDIVGVCHLAPKTPSASSRFCALFVKRCIYLARSWGIIVVGFVVPLVLQLLTVNAVAIPSFSVEEGVQSENGTVPIELRLGALFPGSEVFLQESPASETSRIFRVLVESENARLHVVQNASKDLKALAIEDFPHYIRTYPMGAVFEGNS
ncbi:phospholipid-transporting ATPase ABCA3-like [Haemaphysalis longicornis]